MFGNELFQGDKGVETRTDAPCSNLRTSFERINSYALRMHKYRSLPETNIAPENSSGRAIHEWCLFQWKFEHLAIDSGVLPCQMRQISLGNDIPADDII